MKYRISQLPNSQTAVKYRALSPEGKEETHFHFTKEMLCVWGNPTEENLRHFMTSYLRKNGWSKEPVTLEPAKTPRNLANYIADLQGKEKKSAKKTKAAAK